MAFGAAGGAIGQEQSEFALIREPFFTNPLIWKMTKGVTNTHWGKDLFGTPQSACQSYIMSPSYELYTAMSFQVDRDWCRLVYLETLADWIRAHGSAGGANCQMLAPSSIDGTVPCDGETGSYIYYLYVADLMNNRIVRPQYRWDTQVWTCNTPIISTNLERPRDLDLNDNWTFWPGTDDYLWVLSGRHKILRYTVDGVLHATHDYPGCDGAEGTFCRVAAVASGRSYWAPQPYSNCDDLYVADVGNRRLVWLIKWHGAEPLAWMGEVPISSTVSDIEVDYMGHVWVTDQAAGTITKYTSELEPLCVFGGTGVGENQFIEPVSISNTAGYLGCANMAVLEKWTDSSGGRYFAIGTDIVDLTISSAPGEHSHVVDFVLVDPSDVSVKVYNGQGQLVKTLVDAALWSGTCRYTWDGRNSAGQDQPTGEYCVTVVDTSAVWNVSDSTPVNVVVREQWVHHVAQCCALRGDVDGSGHHNVADLTYLVAYLFRGGPAAPCFEHADINADRSITVADLTFFVNFLFRGGAAPRSC